VTTRGSEQRREPARRGDRGRLDPEALAARDAGRRRLWRLLGAIGLVAVIAGLAAVAYFSPLMSVRTVTVDGLTTLPRGQVLGVADVPMGTPLLQVDTAAVAQRVSTIPAVETVKVERNYPSTITIDVRERTPRVLVPAEDDGLGVMDRLGLVYRTYPSKDAMGKDGVDGRRYRDLPTLNVPEPGPQDPTTLAALTVVGELPGWLAKIVTGVQADSPSNITLSLTKDRTVIWGDDEQSAEKADALMHVLKITGRSYNVSSPEFPAVT